MINTIVEINESRKIWLLRKFAFAAKRVKKGKNYKVWHDGFHPIHLSTNEVIDQRLDYIHNNSVKAGIVYSPEDYVYSSAGSYTDEDELHALQMLQVNRHALQKRAG